VNTLGLLSEFSNELLFAVGSVPSQPATVQKDISRSGANNIFITWQPIISDTLMVQGYKFYADSGLSDPLRLVYDGSSNPQITYFNFDKSANDGV
jgi:hypothetical protein